MKKQFYEKIFYNSSSMICIGMIETVDFAEKNSRACFLCFHYRKSQPDRKFSILLQQNSEREKRKKTR